MKRTAFREQIALIPSQKLIFIDECGFSMNLYRLYGWKIGGGRCEEAVPFNKGINRSALGAFSLPCPQNPTGMWALWQKLGAWTRNCFEAFLSEAVLPYVPKGSVLVLDNARIHHGQKLTQMVENGRRGGLLLALSAALFP